MTALADLQWREPLWWLLALYPLVIVVLAALVQRLRPQPYAETRLLPWAVSRNQLRRRQNRWRQLTHVLAWCCFAMAMAGPRLAEKTYQTEQGQFHEVMIVLDLSQSMAAKDMLPNRLQRARLELLDFLQRAQRTRIGLTVFAARPHLLSPPTYDKAVIRHYLAALKPAMLPTAGSDLEGAILFAQQRLEQSHAHSRAILLLSDGEAARPVDTARLSQPQIPIYVMGVGTRSGQAIVAQLDPRHQQSQATMTRLQREPLRLLARLSHGDYHDASDDDSDWQRLYDQGIARLATGDSDQQATNKILWHELYHVPLLLAFVFFMLSFISLHKLKFQPRTALPLGLLLMTLGLVTADRLEAAEATYAAAYTAYQQADYQRAQELFSQLAGFAARLGEASALYQQADYSAARNTYIQATLLASTEQQRATALFNLGNTFFRLKAYRQAESIYRDVLRYAPKHAAAKNNIAHAQQQQRLQEQQTILTTRPGRGPRTGRASDNLELGNTQVSLGESEAETGFSLPDINQTAATTTMVEQAELASQSVERQTDRHWTYRLSTPAALRLQQRQLQQDETYVWQRLFEQEEGFPAPVALPHPVPGVTPW